MTRDEIQRIPYYVVDLHGRIADQCRHHLISLTALIVVMTLMFIERVWTVNSMLTLADQIRMILPLLILVPALIAAADCIRLIRHHRAEQKRVLEIGEQWCSLVLRRKTSAPV